MSGLVIERLLEMVATGGRRLGVERRSQDLERAPDRLGRPVPRISPHHLLHLLGGVVLQEELMADDRGQV